MNLVLIAAIKAAIIMVVMYTVIFPHMYVFLSNSFTSTNPSLEKDQASWSSTTESNASFVNKYPTASSENVTSADKKEEEEEIIIVEDIAMNLEIWNRIQMEAEKKLQDNPTYRKLREYESIIQEKTEYLKDFSIQLEKKQQDLVQRLNQIQVQTNQLFVFVEQEHVDDDSIRNNSFSSLSTLDTSNFIQILTDLPTMTFKERHSSINNTIHQFTNIYHGLLDGTYQTRDLYQQFYDLDSRVMSSKDIMVQSRPCPNHEQSESTVQGDTQHVRIVDVWETVYQFHEAFYKHLTHRIMSSLMVNWKPLDHDNNNNFLDLFNSSKYWNHFSHLTKDDQQLVQKQDWDSIIELLTLRIQELLELSTITLQSPTTTTSTRNIEEATTPIERSIQLWESKPQVLSKWNKVLGILQKKYKQRIVLFTKQKQRKEDNNCCTKLELDYILDEVFVSWLQNQDIYTSLLRSMEKIYNDKGLIPLTDQDVQLLLQQQQQQQQIPDSTTTPSIENQIHVPSSTPTTLRDILHGPLWSKVGQGLDLFMEGITGYNKHVDSLLANLAQDSEQGQTISQFLGNAITINLGGIKIPLQFYEHLKAKSGILYRGDV